MYEDMTFENIMESMLTRIPDGMDKREGSIIYDATAAVAYNLAETYYMLQNYLDLVFPDTSAGEFLTRFVKTFNVERKEATKAIRYGMFDTELPLESRFSTQESESLVFIAKELLKSEDGIFTYLMECETPGKIGNEYAGKLLPIEYINGLGSAELGDVITVGTDAESDDSLRERFYARVQRPSSSGNANDYYNWAMECTGVGAAKIFPLANGAGTVKVVIASEEKTAVDETLIQDVTKHIESVRPIGASVSVVSAIEKTVNVSVKVKLSTETSLGVAQNDFYNAVDKYLQENAFDTRYLQKNAFDAQYISLARMGHLLMEIKGVEDFTDMTLNGEASNVILSDEEIAVCGAVRLGVM